MENLYLAHHGVKGMRWGVRHDPIKRGRKANKKGLTEKQKKALKIGATAVGAALLIYGTYRLTKNMSENKAFIKAGQDFINNTKLKTSNLEKRVLKTNDFIKTDKFDLDSFNPKRALEKAERGPCREGNKRLGIGSGLSKAKLDPISKQDLRYYNRDGTLNKRGRKKFEKLIKNSPMWSVKRDLDPKKAGKAYKYITPTKEPPWINRDEKKKVLNYSKEEIDALLASRKRRLIRS